MPGELQGAEEATRAYRAIADDAHDMSDAHRQIAAAGESAAKARAPSATGALQSTIRGDATSTAATLGVGVRYWPFTEFGTRYLLAKRYLRAGEDAMRQTAQRAYHDRMAQIIERRT